MLFNKSELLCISQSICHLGASDAIKNVLKLLICNVGGKEPGVMIPIPQYPLYSASLAEFGITQVGYYLDESRNWGLDIAELQVTSELVHGKKNVKNDRILEIHYRSS